MSLFKCKMCGGDLEIAEGLTVAECEYCGTRQAVPKVVDENLQNLFNRANTLRIKSEFDKAEKLYEKIIQADSTQADAYWGLILCKYGIEYVDDPATFKKIPTCHRASYDSIIADDDYKSAIENADLSQRAIYEEQAKEIDRIQKEILALAQKEETYDVFICYKETDANGQRTQDSVIANDIYYQLTNEGFKVFYAAITLEGKLGSAYEPIIFAALNSAKVMLTIGTKPEYFNAVWVKNEWSRFLKIIKKDRSKLLIPCYRDMDAYELPEEFAHLQAQDMSKIGFINDVVRGIKKVITKDEDSFYTKNTSSRSTASSMTQLILNGNDLYEGEVFANIPHGYGKISFNDGRVYEGSWNRGNIEGLGKLIYSNGDIYEGEFKNGIRHGQGKMTNANGTEWVGEFHDDEFWNGSGTAIFDGDDIVYEGKIKNGKFEGYGKYVLGDTVYEGEYKNGEHEGHGKLVFDTGDVYEGEFKNGRSDGQGKWIFANGTVYEGEFKNGYRHGQGKMTYTDGGEWVGEFRDREYWNGSGTAVFDFGKYDGEIKNGKRDGQGKMTNADGGEWVGEFRDGNYWNGNGTAIFSDGKYEGEIRNGQLEGRGKILYDNGNVYEGELKNDKRDGQGKMTNADGTEWVGEFRDGEFWNGSGTLYYTNGDVYEGEIKNGKCDGQGKYTYAKGGEWVGEFRDGEIWTGCGTIYYTDGKYEGEFKNGKKHGQGKMTYTKGGEWVGEFLDDAYWNGSGTLHYTNRDVYEGEFKNGKKHGQGKYTYANGGVYEGEFKNDKLDGQGKYTYAKGGEWVGEFCDGKIWTGCGTVYYNNGTKYYGKFIKGMTENELKNNWLCRHCGGSFKNSGFWRLGIECRDCGRKKDY